jgi:molybdate transport system ATP-binding protein
MLRLAVQKRLGGFRLDAAFEGAPSGVTILFGPSGAGKSSVLAAVAGALRPDAGHISLQGQSLFDAAARIDVPMARRRIGWVFQDARLFPHLSVEGNLRFGLKRAPIAAPRPIAFDEVVSVLGVERLLGRRPRDLSGGERQRVGLGRALLSQPRLLLMDEPLASLDIARRSEILPFFERLKTHFGVPVLYVTHSLAEAVRLGDRMVAMREGRVVAQGPLGEMVSRSDLLLSGSRAQLGAALDGRVIGHDAQLTQVAVGDWIFRAPRLDLPEGAALRLFVLARDVMLALDPPQRISARNVLEGEIASLEAEDGRVLARVRRGGQELLCALTPDAVEALGLRPGLKVWAVVKSVAIDGLGGGLLEALDA